jgi:hypothetical protein
MQDDPQPGEVIGAVAEFLRRVVASEADPLLAFQARVAINALEMVRRQLELAPAAAAGECRRLAAILGRAGDLADLDAEFAGKIASGELDLSTPGVADHLWATTLAKLAVDQPGYAAYRAALAERSEGAPAPENKT